MVDRAKVLEELKKQGYTVSDADNILMVTISPDDYQNASFVKKIKDIIEKNGYKSSWGITTKGFKKTSSLNDIRREEEKDIINSEEDYDELTAEGEQLSIF